MNDAKVAMEAVESLTLDLALDQMAARVEQTETIVTNILTVLSLSEGGMPSPPPSGQDTKLDQRISRFQALNSRIDGSNDNLHQIMQEVSKI